MHTLSIGLNHTTAPIHLRERLAFSEERIRTSLSRLSCGHPSSNLAEMVILSTCNRTELYAVSNRNEFSDLEIFLSEVCAVERADFAPHLYRYSDMQTARHLFHVAAGLDSLVIGEPQILGQITRSLELARGQGAAGPILNRLFQSAIHAGKRARTETAISRNPASVSSLAASLAGRVLRSLADAQVVILGAGEMAELAVEALRQRGATKICVVNRTLARAREIAERWHAEATTFEFLQEALCRADILISSTGAPHTLVSHAMVNQAMQARPERPLILIDIAVPRDIDPAAGDIPHVSLIDMDSLNTQLEDSMAERLAQVPQVNRILEQELTTFANYLHSLDVLPLITHMRRKVEDIRQAELEKTLRRLPDLTEAERARIEAMTQALVKKILEAPTQRLRAEAASPHAPEYAALTRTLFNLNSESNPSSLATD